VRFPVLEQHIAPTADLALAWFVIALMCRGDDLVLHSSGDQRRNKASKEASQLLLVGRLSGVVGASTRDVLCAPSAVTVGRLRDQSGGGADDARTGQC
jgi:hypothetical protein